MQKLIDMSKELKLKIPVKSENKFLVIVELLDKISPFTLLRAKEKELFAWLLYYNDLYLQIPIEDRYILIQSKKKEIAEKMDISMDNYYNIIATLKKKNLIVDEKLNPRYIIGNVDKLIFDLV